MSPSKAGVFLCTLLIFLVVVVQGPPSVAPSCGNPVNFWEAQLCCNKHGNTLPEITEQSKRSSFQKILNEKYNNGTWVNNKRKKMTDWQWLDGAPSEFAYRVPSDQGCALYNQNTKRVEPAKCSDRTVGSICYLNDSKCSSGILSHVGVGHKGICYVHHCERLTWHEARAHCKLWGHTLAWIRDLQVMEILADREWNCRRFWVGLRREEWLDDKNSAVDIIYDHWDPRKHPDKGCGRVEMSETSWIFKPSPCQEERLYICNTTHVHTTMSINTSITDHPTSDPGSNRLLIAFLTSVGLFSLIIGACCAILVWKISRNRKRRLSRMDEETEFVDSSSLLQRKKCISKWLQRHVARTILRNFNRTEVWDWQDETVSVKLDRLYTDLVFVKWTHGPLKPEERPLDVYTDMFSQGDSEAFPYRVFIEGAAGTGKTTLAKRLLVDWARYTLAGWWTRTFRIPEHIKRRLGQFDLVLPIFLRNVSNGQSLAEAVLQNLYIDKEEGNMKDIIEKNQTRILILCEGLDEYREQTAQDITTFLKGGSLKRTNLLITSRNNPKLHFKKTELPTTHIILNGFSDKGVQTYTDRFFRGTPNAYILRQEINGSADRRELSRYPAVLLLMCVLWRDNNAIADSVTEFYFDFLKYICGRYERKFLNEQDRTSPDEIVKKYHDYVMEIGEVAVDGLRGDTLELTFDPSVITRLNDTTKKLGFFNTKHRDSYKKKQHKNVSFQHKTFQEFMAAYYIVNCEPEKRYQLFLHFVSSPNAIKEATMLITFLQGLGKDMITNLVKDITEGSESDAAKTNTAVQLAFLLDTRESAFVLPEVIELELSQQYTSDVLKRYFSMDCSAVKQLTILAPSIKCMTYLKLMKKTRLKEVLINHKETGFTEDSDFDSKESFAGSLRIETLTVEGFGKLEEGDIALLCSAVSEKSQIIFSRNHTHIFVQDSILEADGLIHSGNITSVSCVYAEQQTYQNLLNKLGTMSSLTYLSLQKCLDIQGVSSVLSSNTNLETLHLIECKGGREQYTLLGTGIKHMRQLKEFRICRVAISLDDNYDKYDYVSASAVSQKKGAEQRNPQDKDTNQHMLSPIIANLTEAKQLEVLDLSDNVTTGDLYNVLGNILPQLTHLKELRLGICEQADVMVCVCKGLRHTDQLEILEMKHSTFNYNNFYKLDFPMLKVLKFGKFGTLEAGKPLHDSIQKFNSTDTTQLNVPDLTDNTMDGDMCRVLGDILPQLKHLKELRLGICDRPHAMVHICEGLKYTDQLEILDIQESIVNSDNVMDGEMCIVLRNILPQLKNLRELNFGILDQPHGMMYVCEGLRQTTHFQVLDMLKGTCSSDVCRVFGRNMCTALNVLKHGECVTFDAGKLLLDNIQESSSLTVLDMRRILVSTEVCRHMAEQVMTLTNLRELYLCKLETRNAIMPFLEKISCDNYSLEILDLSGNISDPEPYEVLDVRGRTTGNKVTSDVYQTLGDKMTSLTKLRELRLSECDEPHGLIPVVRSLHHVTQLQALDLSGNTAGLEVFEKLGEQLKHLSKLKLLRLCVSSNMNAVRHVVDKIHLVTELNILDISGLKAKFTKKGVFEEIYNMSNSVDETVYQVLGDQLHHLTDLRELRLCNCNDVDAMRPVITELRQTTKLHTLDLLGNMVEYDVFTEIGRNLSKLGELRELRLCYCRDNNAVGMIVQRLQHTPGLVVLDLRGEMVVREERGVKIVNKNTADLGVYETLGRQLQRLPRLRELRVCKCRSDDRGEGVAVVDGLQYTPGMQVLEMGAWSLDAAGVEQLGERLVNLREMRQLLVGSCDVYGMEYIQPDTSRKYVQIHKAWNKCFSQLSMLSHLQVLNLDDNNIGNDSVVQLSRQLTSLTHLDTLTMFHCGLTDTQAVIQLIDVLPSCPSLRRLDVSENQLDDGLEQIVNMTQQLSQLYWLDLEYNNMSESVVENIKRQLEQELPDLKLWV